MEAAIAPTHPPLAPLPACAGEPAAETVVDRIARLAAEHGGRTAVACHGRTLSYAALWARALDLASAIDAVAHPGDDPVGLLLDYDERLVAAVLGVVAAGRAYVHLDPGLPAERLRHIVEGFGLGALVTTTRTTPGPATALPQPPPAVDLDALPPAPPGWRPARPTAEALACITFTSGSTGRPAGVAVSHRALLFNADRYAQALAIGPDDRLTSLGSPSFAATTTDLFAALASGACLLPFSVKQRGLVALRRWLEDEGATVYHSVPTLFRHLANRLAGAGSFPSLRWVKLGGEPVYPSDVARFGRHFHPDTRLVNGLGLSEAAGNIAWCAVEPLAAQAVQVVPVGYPVPGRDVLILDAHDHPAAPGQAGEIAVLSAYLANGYWRDPAQTRARFTPTPDGRVLLRTGDRGRLLPDGCLVHLGRLDRAVEIRGMHVDPLAVEAALGELPGVRDAAVVARSSPRSPASEPAEVRLVACVVPDGPASLDVGALRQALAGRLPDYMVPAAFEHHAALPLTGTGKIDRERLRQLPKPDAPLRSPPRTPLEERLAHLWAEALSVEAVGRDEHFFDSGGSSMAALELVARLREAFALHLPPSALLERPTVAAMAALIDGGRDRSTTAPDGGGGPAQAERPLLVSLRPSGSRPPLLFVPGGLGGDEELLAVATLLPHLGPEQPVYGLRFPAAPAGQRARAAVRDMARRALDEARAASARGPVVVVGECVGAPVAVELARGLHGEGRPVTLVLLDPLAPRPSVWSRLWLSALLEPLGRLADRWLRAAEPDGDSRPRAHVDDRRARLRAPFPEPVRRAWLALKDLDVLRPATRGLMTALDYPAPQRRTRRALEGYRAEPMPWPLHLILSDEYTSVAPAWEALAGGGFAVHRVPGRHGSTLRRHAADTARALSRVVAVAGHAGD